MVEGGLFHPLYKKWLSTNLPRKMKGTTFNHPTPHHPSATFPSTSYSAHRCPWLLLFFAMSRRWPA